MSFKIATIAAAFALTAAPAVLAQAPTTNLQACVPAGQYNVAYDYFPQKISIADSTSNIEVEYKNNYKIVKNKKSGASYVLYQCGTPAPTVAGTNATFAVPVANVAMLDTTAVTYLELLGVREHIKVSTSPDLITSACLQKMGADKLTTALNDANPAATTTTLNTVDMTISYGDEKIKNATKTYVEFPATSDAGVLHRSQYLQFLAPFFNKEEVANTLTKSISDNYVCLKDAAGKAANVNGKPTVAFMYQYNGNYTINVAPYLQEYITAAGGNPISGVTAETAKFTDAAKFAEAVKGVDVIVDLTMAIYDMKQFSEAYGQSITETTAYKSGNVYAVNKRENNQSGHDWFEAAVVNEHLVIADLITIAHPQLVKEKYESTYFRKLSDPLPVKIAADQCPDVKAPLALTTVTCPSEASVNGAGAPKWGANAQNNAAGRTVAGGFAAVAAAAVASVLVL